MALSRRAVLTTSGGGVAAILASRIPPARGQQWEISYLCWNNFAPTSDKKLSEIGQRSTKDTGIKIRIDHIAHPQQPSKYASEVQTQAGHDLVEMRMHFPWLYEPHRRPLRLLPRLLRLRPHRGRAEVELVSSVVRAPQRRDAQGRTVRTLGGRVQHQREGFSSIAEPASEVSWACRRERWRE
jgi:hypothetical protein